MKSRRFSIFAALSLLLSVAVSVLWVHSESRWDLAHIGSFGTRLNASSYFGHVSLTFFLPNRFLTTELFTHKFAELPLPEFASSRNSAHGLRVEVQHVGSLTIYAISISDWLIVLCTLALPSLWAWRRWRARPAPGFAVLTPADASLSSSTVTS